jgi:hypothetical protein
MSGEYGGWRTWGTWCLPENCCSTVSRHGMNFSSTHLMPTCIVKIAWHDLKEISSFSHASLMINLQSSLTKSHTFAVTSSFMVNEGHPEHFITVCEYVPILKAAEPLRNLCMAHGLLSKGSFNYFISYGSCFLRLWKKCYIHTVFHTLRHHGFDAWHKHYCLIAMIV